MTFSHRDQDQYELQVLDLQLEYGPPLPKTNFEATPKLSSVMVFWITLFS